MWIEADFYEYRPGMKFDDIPVEKVLLIQMEHLRQMDFMITRGVSYERTAYTFLVQITLSDRLKVFKKLKNIVVLLDDAGAIVKREGEWELIFTPDRLEKLTLAEDADLYPVYQKIIEETKKGEKRWVQLDGFSIRNIMMNRPNFDILDKYCRDYPGGYSAVAQKVVIEGPEELYSHVPVCNYGALKTVDLGERESYHSIIELMSDYIDEVDNSEGKPVRPLSLAVFGAPGSGKSFGVKQLAKSLGRFDIFTLNLSQYNSIEEMLHSLDNALTVAKKIPLIFLDEFDSDYNGKALGWLKFLLAPMQDGEYSYNGKMVTIEKAVFVFAGGTASSFREFVPEEGEDMAAFRGVKGPDFVSRLRGILNIKGPNPTAITDRAFIIRRALLLRDMIIRKMPGVYDPESKRINISPSLLSGLLRTREYRHGTRSMEFILDMSHVSGMSKFTPACLPMQNQLNIHLDYKDLHKKLSAERFTVEAAEKYARRVYEMNCELEIEEAKIRGVSAEILESMRAHQPSWEWLSEEKKSNHMEYARVVAEEMEDWNFPIGIRPVSTDSMDTINELYGEMLDRMTTLSHSTNILIMKRNGWKYGEIEDESIKVSPSICDYEELSYQQKEKIQAKIRKMPVYLKEIGLELYKKTF